MNKICLVCLCIITLFTTVKASDVILVDVSGSIAGMGYNSEKLLPVIQQQLTNFVSTNDGDYKIVTFSNKVINAIDAKNLSTLYPVKGNTNLIPAINSISEYTNGTSPFNVFLITDGNQNSGASVEEVVSVLSNLKQNNSVNYYYLVALSEKVKQTAVAGVFDGKNRFITIDSLYKPEQDSNEAKSQTVAKSKVVQTANENVVEENMFLNLLKDWWWLLLLILIIALAVYYFMNNPMILNMPHSMKKGIVDEEGSSKKEKEEEKEEDDELARFRAMSIKEQMSYIINLCDLPVSQLEAEHHYRISNAVKEWKDERMARLPKEGGKGHWAGERGNSAFVVNDDCAVYCRHAEEKMTVKQWRDRYHIDSKIEVPYLNGEPDFSQYSPLEIVVEWKKEYEYKDIKELHNVVNLELKYNAPDWFKEGMDNTLSDPVRDRIEHLGVDGSRPSYAYNVYHELLDGETIQLVPEFLHVTEMCNHTGGRKLARICKSV